MWEGKCISGQCLHEVVFNFLVWHDWCSLKRILALFSKEFCFVKKLFLNYRFVNSTYCKRLSFQTIQFSFELPG